MLNTEPFPPYAFVPGGPWPHPTRSPEGHSFAGEAGLVASVARANDAYLRRGIELFDAGYYWEAHEMWERLWHAFGRRGPEADVVKALIKLAAAGVKVRECQEHGVRTHAARAADLLSATLATGFSQLLGLDLDRLAAHSRRVALDPPIDPGPSGARVTVVFPFAISIAGDQAPA